MSFTTEYGPSQALKNVVQTLAQSELIQIDPQKDVVFETPPPDIVSSITHYFEAAVSRGSNAESPPLSDSDSLFLTQSVAPVVRTVKRHQPSERPALPPISVGSEDERERDHTQINAPHQEEFQGTLPRGDAVSENTDADLLSKTRTALARSHWRLRRPAPSRPTRTKFPFLQKSHLGLLSVQKNHILVNSEIGGFFKCIKKINKGHGGSRSELRSCTYPFEFEEDEMEEDDEDKQDDIKKVDAECFVSDAHRRNRSTWLPKKRWKIKLTSRRTGEKKGKKVTKKKQKRTKSTTRSLHSPLGSPNVRSILMAQVEDSERQPDILVTCSLSQSMDWHCGVDHPGQQVAQRCENLEVAGPESETVVAETQDSGEESADGHVSKMLEDPLRDGNRGEDGLCLVNICTELQETAKDTSEDNHESQETEELDLERGRWIWSQDLFAQEENQADKVMVSSPLKGFRHVESNEDLGSHVVQNDDTCLLGKNKEKPSSISLDIVDRSLVDNADLLQSSQNHVPNLGKITSPRAKEIKQKKKEKHKKTYGSLAFPEENVQFHHAPLSDISPTVHPALDDTPSGSKVNADSGLCQNIVADIQGDDVETMKTAESQMFNYGGLSFLKRKRKQTEVEVSSSSTLLQLNTDLNKSITSQAHNSGQEVVRKKRKNQVDKGNEDGMDINSAVLMEAAGALQKNTVSLDSEVHTAKVSELKAKKNRKRDESIQSLLQENEGPCLEESIQMPHQAPEHVVSDRPKQLRVTYLSSPSRNDVDSEYSSPKVHKEINEDVFPFVDVEQQRKIKKKVKKRSEMSDVVSLQCDEEPEKGHHSGTKTFKRMKRGSYLEFSSVERRDGEITVIKMQSKNHPESLINSEVPAFIEHPANCAYLKTNVTPRKKKKKKKQVVVGNVEPGQNEATEQFEITGEIQDSEQHVTKVVADTKVKKKKKKHRSTCLDTEVMHEEEPMETPCRSENMTPPSSGMETNVSQKGSNSRIHVEDDYGPDDFAGSTPLKKKRKKKRKAMENGFSSASDVMESALAYISSKVEKRPAALCNAAEGIQSVSQAELLHEPARETKKKKKKIKRLSGADVDGGVCGENAKLVGCQRSLWGSQSMASETTPQKKRNSRWDNTDTGPDTRPGLAKKLKTVENSIEVSVTPIEKEQQKEGSVVSTGGELLQNIEKKKKKKKKKQVVVGNVEPGQNEATEQFEITGEIQDSEQHVTKVVADTKVKKKKKKHRSTCLDTEVMHEEEPMETPCRSENMTPPSSGMETNVSQKGSGSRIHVEDDYGPDDFAGSMPLQKKKKRKVMENGFSSASDVMESALAYISSKVEKRPAALYNAAEGIQSVSQTELLHEPARETKKKKKKRLSVADGDVDGGVCGENAKLSGCQRSLQSSQSTASEITPQKKRNGRRDNTDTGSDMRPGLAKKLKTVENSIEVSVTKTEKEQQKEGSVASTGGELLQNIEKKKKKKKKKQVVVGNVEPGQNEATEQFEITGEIQDSEQHVTKVVADTKVKKKKKKHRSTCLDTEVMHEEEPMETPCRSENMTPPSSGMETNVSQKGSNSRILVEDDYGPDYFAGSTPLKKRKEKKTVEKRPAALYSAAEGSQSVSQTELLHEPVRETKKKKKKIKRLSGADGNADGGVCGENAKLIGCQRSIQGSQSTASEITPQKKRNGRWDDTDTGLDTRPGLAKKLKTVENSIEVSVTQTEKEQQKEGSVVSTGGELLQNIEKKKKKKKKKKQVVVGNVEPGQNEAKEQFEITGEIQDSEQHVTKVVADTKVKKKKKKHRSTFKDSC